jgi:hypothetical protein
MKLIRAAPDKASVEISTAEVTLLLTALGSELDYLEPWPEGKLPPDLEGGFRNLHRDLLAVLGASDDSAESAGPPFEVGEPIVLAFSLTGPLLGLQEGETGTIISTHPEDQSRDYPWCVVRVGDGRELELPELVLRRT